MKLSAFLVVLVLATMTLGRANTTLTNQTDIIDYTSNTSANIQGLYLYGTSTLVLDDTANVNVSDSSYGQVIGYGAGVSPGGAETIVAENSGSGNFVFTIGSNPAYYGRNAGSTINYVVENTGTGTTTIDSSVKIGNGGDGNDLTYWAFYEGNDYAMTSPTGVLEAATTEYNDGGHDTGAMNLATWAGNGTSGADVDYTSDSPTTTYFGTLTGNAEKHGIRISNAAGASFDLGGNTLTDAGILDAQGAGAVTISDGTLTAQGLTYDLIIDQNNTLAPMTISANITGTSTTGGASTILEKVGVGTLILSGANNTYAGTTFLSQGTLQVDGVISGSGSVLLEAGATLSGSGSILSKVTAETATSVVAPGDPNTKGILIVNSLAAPNGLTMDFQLDGEGATPGQDNGVLEVSGFTVNGTLTVNITTSDTLLTDYTYVLAAGLPGDWSGTPTVDFVTPAGYGVESYDFNSGADAELSVVFDLVPEPSIWAMLGLGVMALAWRLHRLRAS